jgi:hypothetical protein
MLIDADDLPTQETGDRPSDYAVRMAATAASPLITTGGTVRVITADGGEIRTAWSDVMVDLARVKDQKAGTSSRWADRVAVGERLLAFVHSSNSELLASLTAIARSGSEVAAVVFEGFMPGDDAGHAVNTLTSVGINAISCSKGEFSKAVREMEQGIGFAGSVASAPTPSTELEAIAVDNAEELAA